MANHDKYLKSCAKLETPHFVRNFGFAFTKLFSKQNGENVLGRYHWDGALGLIKRYLDYVEFTDNLGIGDGYGAWIWWMKIDRHGQP